MPSTSKKTSGISTASGELLINVQIIDQWEQYLRTRNLGKVGGPYQYPDSYIKLLNCLRTHFDISYRELEKIVDEMSKYIGGIEKPDYTTIYKRLKTEPCILPLIESLRKKEGLTIIFNSPDNIDVMSQKSIKVQLWKARRVYRRIFFKQDSRGKIIDIKIS
jgi:hypothetical protein